MNRKDEVSRIVTEGFAPDEIDLGHGIIERQGGEATGLLQWHEGEARSPLGDLYEVARLSSIVWQTSKNGTAYPRWSSSFETATKIAQTDYDRQVSPAPAWELENLRGWYDAFTAMRNDINVLLGNMESQEANLEPGMGAECAAVVKAVADYVARATLPAVVEEAVKGDEWQDIATAPNDGTAVLVAVTLRSGEQAVGEAYFHYDGGSSDEGWWWAGTSPGEYADEAIGSYHSDPTHWQPLPAPPTARSLP